MTPARADGEQDAGSVAGADDHVLRPWRTVHEVPLPERPLLALDDEQRFPREHEEVLLVRFPVVHRHRLTRLEDGKPNPDLSEVALAAHPGLEADPAVPPARLADVEHEPARAAGHESVFRVLERRLGNHVPILKRANPRRLPPPR